MRSSPAFQARLGEADAVEAFDRKLVAHGYAPLPDYDEPALLSATCAAIVSVTVFRVDAVATADRDCQRGLRHQAGNDCSLRV